METTSRDTCSQHPITCKELTDNAKGIEEGKEEHVRLRAAIEKAVTTKAALGVLSILVSVFLGLFFFSVNLNMSAIKDIADQNIEKTSTISRLFRLQSESKDRLIKIESNVDTLASTMNEVKSDVKDLQRQNRQ